MIVYSISSPACIKNCFQLLHAQRPVLLGNVTNACPGVQLSYLSPRKLMAVCMVDAGHTSEVDLLHAEAGRAIFRRPGACHTL